MGPDAQVEWIRVYVPGPLQLVVDFTWDADPDDISIHREWRKFYHFQVRYPIDDTAGATLESGSQPVTYDTFYTWYYRDWHTRGYQRLGRPHPNIAQPSFPSAFPDLKYAGLSSSTASSGTDDD